MGKGEYVYATGNDFSVHACHRPWSGDGYTSGVSSIMGLGIKSKWGVIKFTGGTPEVPADSGITVDGSSVTFPTGEVVFLGGNRPWLFTTIALPASYCGNVHGICGAFSPEQDFANKLTVNDANLTTFNGQHYTMGSGPYLGEFQSVFAESWKVSGDDAVFTAEECPSSSPYDKGPPEAFANCPTLKAQAEAQCPSGEAHQGCMADVGSTCDLEKWVNAAKEADEAIEAVTNAVEEQMLLAEEGEEIEALLDELMPATSSANELCPAEMDTCHHTVHSVDGAASQPMVRAADCGVTSFVWTPASAALQKMPENYYGDAGAEDEHEEGILTIPFVVSEGSSFSFSFETIAPVDSVLSVSVGSWGPIDVALVPSGEWLWNKIDADVQLDFADAGRYDLLISMGAGVKLARVRLDQVTIGQNTGCLCGLVHGDLHLQQEMCDTMGSPKFRLS